MPVSLLELVFVARAIRCVYLSIISHFDINTATESHRSCPLRYRAISSVL